MQFAVESAGRLGLQQQKTIVEEQMLKTNLQESLQRNGRPSPTADHKKSII